MKTYRVEIFKDGEWIEFMSGLGAFDANFYAGIVSRNSNFLQRTVNEETGEFTHGRVREDDDKPPALR